MSVIAPVITVDGPSGVGKGTLCQALAIHFNWNLLDSGAIYRVLAFAAQYHNINISSEDALVLLAQHLDVKFVANGKHVAVILEGKDVSQAIRNEIVANAASKIAVFSNVREALLHRQRSFRALPGLIADGRDMGTIVFPDAPVKFFLDATPEERANRRMLQLQDRGNSVKFERLLSEIKERDQRDRHRPIAPLVAAHDALIIDTTSMSITEVVTQSIDYAERLLDQVKK